MKELIIQISGWIPAIIIPTATFLQLRSIVRKKSTKGVEWLSWFLFGVANIGLYIYTEKYGQIQTILGLLGTAVMDFIIVALVLKKYGEKNDR